MEIRCPSQNTKLYSEVANNAAQMNVTSLPRTENLESVNKKRQIQIQNPTVILKSDPDSNGKTDII